MRQVASIPPRAGSLQYPVLVAAALGILAVTVLAGLHGGIRLALAALIGTVAGIALYHAAFGFTAGWRAFIQERRSAGLRAQFLTIGLTALFALPLIAHGGAIGLPVHGFVFPFGVATMSGAFLFGLGMQLGGGCGSGTLFTVGGGSTRMLITLAAFIAGSFLATLHWAFWIGLPSLPPTTFLTDGLRLSGTLFVTIGALAALSYFAWQMELDRHGEILAGPRTGSILTGPWSLRLGAVALAAVGLATLLVLQRPWGITAAFSLWGAKIAYGLGLDVGALDYWHGQMAAIERSVFADATSIMDFGIILGALAAAALAGRFAPTLHLSLRDVVTAIAGGLLMGYGARLAFGCNIGGLIGGIISGSLHGWGWLLFGFAGSIAGVRIRRWIGMDAPLPATAAAP